MFYTKKYVMKKIVLSLAMVLLLWGCDEPETLLVNIVARDGSVQRKIVYTTKKDTLNFEQIRVPADTSWSITRELLFEESEKDKIDTLYVYTLQKGFRNVDEINALYQNGKDKNMGLTRRSEFGRSFRWFTTRISFKEVVEPVLQGFHPSGYFSPEELKLFYMPEELREKLGDGADSTYYKSLQDSLDVKYDKWITESLVNQWIVIMDSLAIKADKNSPATLLRDHLSQLADSLDKTDDDEIAKLEEVLGKEFVIDYKEEIDSSFVEIESILETIYSAGSYTVGLEMPGKLISTNGYQAEEEGLRWFVKDDYYLCEPYVMWSESVVPNRWAWIVTAGFIIFVFTGIVMRSRKKL